MFLHKWEILKNNKKVKYLHSFSIYQIQLVIHLILLNIWNMIICQSKNFRKTLIYSINSKVINRWIFKLIFLKNKINYS